MYLRIGNNFMVRKSAILGIFDLDNATWSHWTRKYLNGMETQGRVVNAAMEEIPNSFLLCEENGIQRVYLSMLTVQTLQKRAKESIFTEKPGLGSE